MFILGYWYVVALPLKCGGQRCGFCFEAVSLFYLLTCILTVDAIKDDYDGVSSQFADRLQKVTALPTILFPL